MSRLAKTVRAVPGCKAGRGRSLAGLLATAWVLAGCYAQPPRPPEPDPTAAGVAGTAPDLRRGELLSLACQACHRLEAAGAHLIGPNLGGVFGRRAGQLPGFVYSDVLATSAITWSPAALDAWLAAPERFLPGTTMAFTGYTSAVDRRDLIAFLEAATAQPAAPLP